MIRSLTRGQRRADIAIAAGFGAVFIVTLRSPELFFLVAGMAVALAFRRLSPAIALGLAWLSALAQLVAGYGAQPADLAILAILYAVGSYGGRALRWLGLISAAAGALIATLYTVVVQNTISISTGGFSGRVGQLVLVFILALTTSFGVLGLSWTLGLLARTRRVAQESKAAQAVALAEQQRAQERAEAEQERGRIARDMHDVVAHSLAVVIAQADGARYAGRRDSEAVESALATISQTAREALGDVRVLLTRLRHDQTPLPQPGVGDLDRLLDQLRAAGLRITDSATGSPRPLGAAGGLALYRVAQEALTNALRHGATDDEVTFALEWDDARVTLRVSNVIRNDGSPSIGGHGLPGMRERAVLAGGDFTAGPSGAGRYSVTARIPYAAQAAEQAQRDQEDENVS